LLREPGDDVIMSFNMTLARILKQVGIRIEIVLKDTGLQVPKELGTEIRDVRFSENEKLKTNIGKLKEATIKWVKDEVTRSASQTENSPSRSKV